MKCTCGNNRFYAHQIIRADIIADESGSFEKNLPGGLEAHVYDSGRPYGPFVCTKCCKEYDELH